MTKKLAESSVAAAVAEEGRAKTVWDLVQGMTAHARSIPHTDDRLAVERMAGDLVASVAE